MIWLNKRLVMDANSNGLNLISTSLTLNQNSSLFKPWYSSWSRNECTNFLENLISSSRRRCLKYVPSNNCNYSDVSVDLIFDMAIHWTWHITSTWKCHDSSGIHKSPSSRFLFLEVSCKKKLKVYKIFMKNRYINKNGNHKYRKKKQT